MVEHDLPGRDQLEAIARGWPTEPGELPEGDGLDAVLDAAAGLTRIEAENASASRWSATAGWRPTSCGSSRRGTLKKSGLLTLHRGGETFADLGGLEALKAFCAAPCGPAAAATSAPRGVLLLGAARLGQERLRQGAGQRDGPPDAGPRRRGADGLARRRRPRPTSARRCGSSTRWPRASCSSTRSRRPSPASPSSGQADSGVSARLFGSLLALAERPRPATSFFVCTANDISQAAAGVQPGRAVRRDVLPRPARRRARRRRSGGCTVERFGLDPAQRRPRDTRLDRRGDPGVLPAGGAAGHPADRGGAEHRAGGGHGGRVGRAAAHLGQRAAACRPTAPASTPATARRPRGPAATSGEATRRPTDRPTRHATSPRPHSRPGRRATRPVASHHHPEAR